MRHSRTASLLCLGTALVGQAPEDPAGRREALLALMNTRITLASKRDQPLMDSPQAIEVLTGDEIRQQGITRLADALKLMTSLDVLERDSEQTVIGIRGVMQNGRPRTVQILVDGVPLYNAEQGSIDVDNLPIPVEAIERVEVVRGPSSSLYGANAVAGVIAITSRKAAVGFTGSLRFSRAGLGTSRWSGESRYGSGGFGVGLAYAGASFGASNVEMRGLGSPSGPFLPTANDRSHQASWLIRPTYTWGDSTLWASVGEANKRFEQPYVEPESPWQATQVSTHQAGWRQIWTSAFTTEVRYSHTGHTWTLSPRPSFAAQLGQLSALFPTLNVPTYSAFYSASNPIDFTSNLTELQLNHELSPDFHLVGGADVRHYEAGTSQFQGLQTPATGDAKGAFLSLDWSTTPTLALSLGARWEQESIGGSRTSPRVAFVWNPTPSSALRGGYFTATRSPQMLESDINFNLVQPNGNPPFSAGVIQVRTVPNAGLRPEEIHNVELGYRVNLGITTVDLTVFQMKFKKLISETDPVVTFPTPVPNPFGPGTLPVTTLTTRNQNIGEATDKGLELALTFQLPQGWTLGLNATHLDYRVDTAGATAAPDGNLAYAPQTKVNAWARATHGAFSGFVAVQYVGATLVESAASFQGPAVYERRAASTTLHGTAAWEFRPGCTLSVYARNANRETNPQGAGGVLNLREYRFARRELGATVAVHF